MNPPEEDSEDDIMLWSREISIGHDHKDYPLKAMHVYAKNSSCDEWNKIMLNVRWQDICEYSKRL